MEILFLRVDYFFPWPTEAAFDISKEIQRLWLNDKNQASYAVVEDATFYEYIVCVLTSNQIFYPDCFTYANICLIKENALAWFG